MKKHKAVIHINCQETHCPVCDGGLYICEVCGLIEGSLTTDCPGVESWCNKNELIYKGLLDYKNGEWVKNCSPHSPQYFKG